MIVAALLLTFFVEGYGDNDVCLYAVGDVGLSQQMTQWFGQARVPGVFQGMNVGTQRVLVEADGA